METSDNSAADPADSGPWLEVDLDALRRNAVDYAGRVGVPLIPMVKANGYGLGGAEVAAALESLGPWGYGVATLGEARQLRSAGIERPVVVFRPFGQGPVAEYAALRARPTIGGPEELRVWLAHGDHPFHLSIETGMGRGGIPWHDRERLRAVRELLAGGDGAPVPGYEGVFTHFHSADLDEQATEIQWRRFEEALGGLGARPPLVHAANSAAGRWGRRYAGTAARPGIFLYGGRAGPLTPEPVARFIARVDAVAPVRAGDTVSYGATFRAEATAELAVLGAGYADGIHRALGNRGLVAFGDRRVSIAGQVTMDMTMAVVPVGAVRVGDRAAIFGGPIPLDDQAHRAGTISYELLTAVGSRVTRRYSGGNR
jgi:alanine racemase